MTTVFANKALLPGGWATDVSIRIDSGRFADVSAGARRDNADVSVGIAIPGLGNAHSHAFQRALSGHTEQRSPAERDNFWTWREKMYALAGQIDAAALTAIARQAYCEMLRSGFTSVVEFHYLHQDPTTAVGGKSKSMFEAIFAAAADSGIRLTYVPVHYERAGFSQPEPGPRQRSFAMSIDDFLGHYEEARQAAGASVIVGIGAHSLRAVSRSSLQQIAALAETESMPMHLHIAEQRREVDDCYLAYGARPVRLLLDNFDVGRDWCLVHATHMDTDEVQAVAASGAVVALCPSTEANLGDGLFPLHDFLQAGGRFAIGSDSHVTINPFEELRWLEYGQRLATETRNVSSLRDSHVGSELFGRALTGGAAAAGIKAGSISVGSDADFVALDDDDPMLVGHTDTSRLDALVFSGYPLPIDRVMVNGRWCVVGGDHVARGVARAAYAKAVRRIDWSAAE